jgi:hypothetical protein
MQFGAKPPLGIVYDVSFGDSPEDVAALELLYSLAAKNECRVVALAISKPNLKSAIAAEMIARAAGASPRRALPIGLATAGPGGEDTPIIQSILDRKLESSIQSINDTAEPHALIRNALTAQHDKNAVIVCCGRVSNILLTLDLPGARAIIEQKTKFLVLAAEPKSPSDAGSLRRVLASWPGEVILVGAELASRYATAIQYAVRSTRNQFTLSESGVVAVNESGATTFRGDPHGRHRIILKVADDPSA